jgi:hypothetical protein
MATRIGPRKSPTSPRPPVGKPSVEPALTPIARFARRLTSVPVQRTGSFTVALANRSN